MTGDTNTNVERVIVSRRLIAPESYCCRDVNSVATKFLQSINISREQPRLSAEMAVKALDGMSAIGKKPTYEDTDNKKRDFTGDVDPGIKTNELNYRWDPNKTWSPGDRLVIHPPYESLEGLSGKPNVGWITPDENKPKSFDELIQRIEKKPHIQLTMYDVDPKTDNVIDESARIIDPTSPTSGMTAEERRRSLQKYSTMNTKRLPGRTIGERLPGGSIIGRVAAAFGVIRDAQNKFRCPPGTPAANQFTDAFGSNCFGFSPSKFARFAARAAERATADGEFQGVRNTAEKFFSWLYEDKWGFEQTGGDPARIARNAWYDALTGDRFKTPDWMKIDVPAEQRTFRNGAAESIIQDARAIADVDSLSDALGITATAEEKATNADRHKVFEALRQLSDMTGGEQGWDLRIINMGTGRDGDTAPMTPEEVDRWVRARISTIPGIRTLSQEEIERLVRADTQRYYELERAFLDTYLHEFMKNPAMARKQLQQLEYDFSQPNEAGTGVIPTMGRRIPMINPETGEALLDEAGNPMFIDAGSSGFSQFSGVIHMNFEQIMSNTETMLPKMLPNQRLAVSAVGAVTDAEARLAVADFIMNQSYAARHVAGLVNGPRGFARHIALHEWAHSIQGMAFVYAIQNKIKTDGFLDIPFRRKDGSMGFRRVTSMRELSSDDIMQLMQDTADTINIKDLKDAMERIKLISPLAGNYPSSASREGSEIWAMEASAELWALREAGLIYGEDIDKALEWMDDVAALSAEEDAVRRIELESRIRTAYGIEDPSVDPADPSDMGDIAPDDLDALEADAIARDVESRRLALAEFETTFKDFSEDEMFEEAAIIASELDSAKSRLARAEEVAKAAGPADADLMRAEINTAKRDIDFHTEKYKRAKKVWRSKYGIGASGELDRFDENVTSIRRTRGMYEPAELERIAREAHLDDIRDELSKMSPDDAVRKIADHKIMMSRLDKTSPEMIRAAEELDVMKTAYVEKLRSSGDSRTRARITKDLDEKIEAIVSPKPKTVKSFKTGRDAKDFGKSQRARMSRKLTPEQRRAIKESGTFSDTDIIQFLDEPQLVKRGRAINRRNERLRRLGLEVDATSAEEGSLDDQVKNILIPVLESMEVSSASEAMNIDSVIEFAPRTFEGRAVGKEIDVDHFVTGKIMAGDVDEIRIPRGEVADRETWRRKRRIIIQVNEGDRGLFPSPGKEGDQEFVMPPGRLRIIGRDADGTLRAEFVSQKSTDEVLGTMLNTIDSGTDDAIWRKGARRRVGTVVHTYTSGRLSSGGRLDTGTDRSGREIRSTNKDVVGRIIDSGGSFGEAVDDMAITDELDEFTPDTSPLKRAIYDPSDPDMDAVLGAIGTRSARKKLRGERISSALSDIDPATLSLLRDSFGPIDKAPPREVNPSTLINDLENSAFEFHMGLDRKVRVRMTEQELVDLGQNGSVRYRSSSGRSGMTRRLSSRLSSGATQPNPDQLKPPTTVEERKNRVAEVAKSAARVFDELSGAEGAIDIDTMTAKDIEARFKRKYGISLSSQPSIGVNGERRYVIAGGEEADSVSVALALMMLGKHVELQNGGTIMTQQAQQEFEQLIDADNGIAARHVETNNRLWREFLDKKGKSFDFEQFKELEKRSESGQLSESDASILKEYKGLIKEYKDNFQIDLCKLYNPETNLMCSGHLGIKREDMPQLNGRTKGANTTAIRMLKEGYAAGKFEADKKLLAAAGADENKPTALLAKHAAAVAKAQKKAEEKGKKLSDIEALYEVLSKAHSVQNDHGDVKQLDHRESSWKNLTDDEKQWLYSVTNWQNVEVNLEQLFIDLANRTIKTEGGPGVVRKRVDGSKFSPSQMELVGSKVDDTNQTILDTVDRVVEALSQKTGKDGKPIVPGHPEFRQLYEEEMYKEWFMQPILVTRDGYILDGHHRWAGLDVANRILRDRGLELELSVNELQTDIIEGLTLGKVMQDVYGIKEAKIGAESPFQGTYTEIQPISASEIADVETKLNGDVPELARQVYANGTYINKDSVGLSVRGAYRESVMDRRSDALFDTSGVEEAFSRGERTPALAGRMASGGIASRRSEVGGNKRRATNTTETGRTAGKFRQPVYRPEPGVRPEDLVRQPVYRPKPGEKPGENIQLLDSIDSWNKNYHERIGLPSDIEDELRPVSGYVVHGSHIAQKRKNAVRSGKGNGNPDGIFEVQDNDLFGDGLTALGEIEIVLHPSVANRTAYGRGSSATSAHRPVMLNSTSKDDVSDAVFSFDGPNGKDKTNQSVRAFAEAKKSRNMSEMNRSTFDGEDEKRDILQAHILGGFDKDEIAQINYPFSKIMASSDVEDISDVVNDKTIASRLRAAGFTPEEIQYFYSMGFGGKINTQSMIALRQYRKAQKVRKTFGEMGFNNIKFAHPNGINIDDPRSYAKSAGIRDAVEKVLNQNIAREIRDEAEKMLKDFRKPGVPEMIPTRGR